MGYNSFQARTNFSQEIKIIMSTQQAFLPRRRFLKSATMALAAVSATGLVVGTTTGCNDSWIQTAINDMPAAIAIIESIASIASLATGNALITPAIATIINTAASLIKSGLLALQDAITAYQSSKSSTTLGKIDDTLAQLLADLNTLLPQITILDQATKTAITTGIALLISTLSTIQVLIPPSVSPAAAASRRAQAHATLASRTVLPTAAQIKSQFNAVVTLNGYPSAVVQ